MNQALDIIIECSDSDKTKRDSPQVHAKNI